MSSMTRTSRKTPASFVLLRVGACAVMASATPALAQRAGTAIVNIATAEMDIDNGQVRIASNSAALRVDEVLGITLAAGPTRIAATDAQPAAPFVLTNSGSGNEAFVLAGNLQGNAANIRGFAIDTNGNGRFDQGDILLPSALTPVLAPGQTTQLLALLDPATVTAASGSLDLFARAATGSGAPGKIFPGRGDQGVDAVVGPTTAEATLRFPLDPGAPADATLVKTQTVMAPNGTADMAMRGATITYSLAARFTGGMARAASVRDPIPLGTDYVPGSLTLDGAALSDVADGDGGSFDGVNIAVNLGDIATPQTRIIQFKVTIQ